VRLWSAYPSIYPGPWSPTPEWNAAEQGTEDWLNALTSVTLELARAVGAERWQAIGLSAMLPTLVPTDDAGAAATPRGTGVSRTWPTATSSGVAMIACERIHQ
jgi:sugar (pentulose or hexulose) kinase